MTFDRRSRESESQMPIHQCVDGSKELEQADLSGKKVILNTAKVMVCINIHIMNDIKHRQFTTSTINKQVEKNSPLKHCMIC